MEKVLGLKRSNCKNCYKCIRHCPVKSIKFLMGRPTSFQMSAFYAGAVL